jgi:hypothetical protein
MVCRLGGGGSSCRYVGLVAQVPVAATAHVRVGPARWPGAPFLHSLCSSSSSAPGTGLRWATVAAAIMSRSTLAVLGIGKVGRDKLQERGCTHNFTHPGPHCYCCASAWCHNKCRSGSPSHDPLRVSLT